MKMSKKVKKWVIVASIAAMTCATSTISRADDDITCLAKNIYFEARDQTREGRYAVAMVTLNRVMDNRFPNDICEVVYQRNQFSWYWDGKSDTPYEKDAWEEAVYVAKAIIMAYPNLYDPTYGSLFYKRYDVHSNYFNRLTPVVSIGEHRFYK